MKEKDNNKKSSISHRSIFNESINIDKNDNPNKDNNAIDNKNNEHSENQKILKFFERFLGKKRKILTEEEKKERIQKNKKRYCQRNNEMLVLLEKINSNETTHKNIKRVMRLLSADLYDTKKLINQKSLISNQKNEIFKRLLNFTYKEYQYFWYRLTDGKIKKGNAQIIKSSNISKAKQILKEIEESKKKKMNDMKENNNIDNNNNNKEENNKKERTIKEIIQAADLRDFENEILDNFFREDDSVISSDNSLSSSLSDSDDDNNSQTNSRIIDNNNIEEKINNKKEIIKERDNENEKKEKEEREIREKKEREKKEREKKIKKIIEKEEEDDIDIFN